MLIVDFNTLQTVYTLYFLDHVILNRTHAFDSQNIMWVDATFCQFITGFKYLSLLNLDTGTVRDEVCFGITCLVVCNNDFTFLLRIADRNCTAELCDDGKTLWFSCLEKFFDTRKTLCDIITSNTTGMESTHCQLCTRFTDGLSGDNTDSFTHLNNLTSCHVGTVTLRTDTKM